MSRLVIKRHQPLRPLLWFLTVLVVFAIALVVTIDYAEWKFLLGTMSVGREEQQAIADNLKLRKDNRRMAQELEQLRRAVQIDKEARRQSQTMIEDLERSVAEFKREVAFYREVLRSPENKAGPRLQGARVTRLGSGQFRVTVVLTHMGSGTQAVKGRLKLTVGGRLQGNPQKRTLADVAPNAVPTFEFRHFHLFEADMALPEGFAPERLEVQVFRDGRDAPVVSTTYPWGTLLR